MHKTSGLKMPVIRKDSLATLLLVTAGLYASSLYSYLLFHALIELFAIVVGVAIFLLAWNTRQTQENSYVLFLGIASLFAAVLELFHALSYRGMGVFPAREADLATQFWIAYRYVFSLSFLAAPVFLGRRLKVPQVSAVFAAGTALLCLLIFSGRFPASFVEGQGLTRFKVVSEYIITAFFAAGLAAVIFKRAAFERDDLFMLGASLTASILAELSFTQYASVYGPANMIGHFFLFISVITLYRAIIVAAVRRPADILYRDLKHREAALRESDALLRLFIEHAPASLAMFDREMRYLSVSSRWLDDYGLGGRSIIGRNHYDVFSDIPERWKEAHRRALAGEVVRNDDDRYERADGSVQQLRWEARPWHDAGGGIAGVVIFTEDITDHKRSLALTEHLASFPRQNPNPVIEADIHGKVTFFNPAVEKALAGSGKDAGAAALFLPPDIGEILKGWNGKSESVLYREVAIGDRTFGESVCLNPYFGIVRVYAYDITERRGMEVALRESEGKYRNLFDNMINGLAYHTVVFDAGGRPVDYVFREVNRSFESLVGLSGAEILGKRITQVFPGIGDDPSGWIGAYGRVALTGQEVQFEQRAAALDKWFLITAYRPAPGHIATVFEDITARKLAEEALRESESLYRAIGESIDFGIWICDPEGRNIYASDSFLKLVGLTQEQCSNFGWGDVLHPDDAERTIAAWKECVRTGGAWDIEHRFRGVDGRYHPVLARGVSVRDGQGRVLYWAGINLDISQLKETEEKLRASEERLLAHIDNSPLAVIEFDRQLRVIRWSAEAERMFGWTASEIVGSAIGEMRWVYEEDAERVRQESSGLSRGERRRSLHVNRNYRKDGSVILCEWYNSAIYDAEGALLSIFSQVLDITERAKSQDALRHMNEELEQRVAERTAELRNLQAHIEAVREGERAHIAREVHDQLGQAMTALKMDLAWLKRNHPSRNAAVQERSREMLELIDGAIRSVKRITSELRPSVLDDFGLQAAVEWAAQEFEKRSGVACRVSARPESITMDRTRSTVVYRVLQEALTNVARHARAKHVAITLDGEGERFRMTVQDDGRGISREKIGDPSSYGLMGMRERLRFLGGDIVISGKRGKGTAVTITVPLTGTEVPPGGIPPQPDGGGSNREETRQ